MSMEALADSRPTAHGGKPLEDTMKKTLLAAVAVLSLVFGTAALSPEAQASEVYLFPPAQTGNG